MVHSGFSELPAQWAFPKEQHELAYFWGTPFDSISDKKVKKAQKFYATLNSKKICLEIIDKFRTWHLQLYVGQAGVQPTGSSYPSGCPTS